MTLSATKLINDYGKKFINMCINTDMLILNGRTDGDIHGRFTYNSHIGNSTIDYAFISSQIAKDIVYFHVKGVNVWSDHSLITLCLKIKYTLN